LTRPAISLKILFAGSERKDQEKDHSHANRDAGNRDRPGAGKISVHKASI
jgi:hypothetical protein